MAQSQTRRGRGATKKRTPDKTNKAKHGKHPRESKDNGGTRPKCLRNTKKTIIASQVSKPRGMD